MLKIHVFKLIPASQDRFSICPECDEGMRLEMNVEEQGCSPHAMLPCHLGIPKWKAAVGGCSSYWRARLAAELAGRDGPCVYLLLVVASWTSGFP